MPDLDDLFPIQVIPYEGETWVNVKELVCFLRVIADETDENPGLYQLADRIEELGNAGR